MRFEAIGGIDEDDGRTMGRGSVSPVAREMTCLKYAASSPRYIGADIMESAKMKAFGVGRKTTGSLDVMCEGFGFFGCLYTLDLLVNYEREKKVRHFSTSANHASRLVKNVIMSPVEK